MDIVQYFKISAFSAGQHVDKASYVNK